MYPPPPLALAPPGSNTIWCCSTAILQLRVGDALRGRIFAIEFTAYTLAEGGSAWLAGQALDAWGASLEGACMALAAAGLLLAAVWALHSYVMAGSEHERLRRALLEGCNEAPPWQGLPADV